MQGYLGYKNTPARGSVGRCFLDLRKPRAKTVGLRSLKLRKCTRAVGSRLKTNKKTHESGESGRSFSLKMRPVRVNVLH